MLQLLEVLAREQCCGCRHVSPSRWPCWWRTNYFPSSVCVSAVLPCGLGGLQRHVITAAMHHEQAACNLRHASISQNYFHDVVFVRGVLSQVLMLVQQRRPARAPARRTWRQWRESGSAPTAPWPTRCRGLAAAPAATPAAAAPAAECPGSPACPMPSQPLTGAQARRGPSSGSLCRLRDFSGD